MIRAILFDLDGTLADSLPGIAASLNRALARHGLPAHPLAAVRGFIGNGARMLVARALPAGSGEEEIARLEQAFKADYDLTWHEGTRAFPEIPALLDRLAKRDLKLAVLSNKPHDFTEPIVRRIFPETRFDFILGHRHGREPKPDPAGALEIAETLGFPPAHCALVGDSTVDLETARHAGMSALAVTWGYHDRPALESQFPDAWIESPADLDDWLDARTRA